MHALLWALCGLCVFTIIYHHLIYPLLLNAWARWRSHAPRPAPSAELPSIGLIIPCYNEAGVIADKLANLAALDYPAELFQVYLICDGCDDDTAAVARRTADSPHCEALRVEVIEHSDNRGKLHRLNQTVAQLSEDIVALSDASALLSLDALRLCAQHFESATTGAVAGSYFILDSGGAGQEAYWRYQIAIKKSEDTIGSTLGAHGAFYALRRHLYRPPPDSIINDDFVIPMYVIQQGYRVRYEPEIMALELEQLAERDEQRRRRRLAAGNVQMILHLLALLNPRHGAIAWMFFSGKTLRAFMPVFLLGALLTSAVLALDSGLMQLLLAGQLLVYGLALWQHRFPDHPNWRLLRVLHYIVAGHMASALGLYQYVFRRHSLSWS